MWYQNICSALFSFVTILASDGRTDRQTDGQNCDSNTVRCITCRTVTNDGLDQYNAEPFEQQQFGTAGVEGVNVCGCDTVS